MSGFQEITRLLCRSMIIPLVAAFGFMTISVQAQAQRSSCIGDCDGNGSVTVDELVRGVNIALGTAPLQDCSAFDANGNLLVTVDELVTAVNNALQGCPADLTSTPTPEMTATDTPTEEPTDTPTEAPTDIPTNTPIQVPTDTPSVMPTDTPTQEPTDTSTEAPTETPTASPTPTTVTAPTPSDVTRSVAGRASVVANGLGAIPSVVTAIVSGIEFGGAGGGSVASGLPGPFEENGGAAGVCPQGGTATKVGSIPGAMNITLSNCRLATASGSMVLNGTVNLSGLFTLSATVDVQITFKDSNGTDEVIVTADLTATITAPDLGGDCYLTGATMRLNGSLSAQIPDEGGMETQFNNTLVDVTVNEFNDDCVPVDYELVFNGGATFTETGGGDSFDVTFDDFTFEQDATAVPAVSELNGDIVSTCFGGSVTLMTEVPLESAPGNPCPVGGVIRVISQGDEQKVVYSGTGVGLDSDGDGNIDETHPSCLVPDLFPDCQP